MFFLANFWFCPECPGGLTSLTSLTIGFCWKKIGDLFQIFRLQEKFQDILQLSNLFSLQGLKDHTC